MGPGGRGDALPQPCEHGNELGTGLGAAVASAGNVKSVSRGLVF